MPQANKEQQVIQLADRTWTIEPSVTLELSARAKALRASGVDVCDFTVGEPDFNTPAHIREAAKRALDEGKTKYAPAGGVPRLQELIAAKLRDENSLSYSANQVIVCTGGKQAILNVLLAILSRGDEALIPTPYWVSYPEIVKLARAVPILMPTTEATAFKITPEQLEAAITPQTKVMILNSPSNPTGAIYSRAEMTALAEVLVRHEVAVLSDEIYEKLLYDGVEHVSIGSLGEAIFNLTITCNGFSKAYAATGWRLGYAAGPAHVIKYAVDIQSHTTSGATTFAQYGAIAALEGPQDEVEAMRCEFERRRNVLLAGLQTLTGMTCTKPGGAFYLFPNIAATGLSSMDFSQRLLEEYHVAIVPGAAFGADANVRFSYATSMATIEKGLERLQRFMESL